MKFIFACPENNRIFETDRFNIIEDRGITKDKSGNKFWDAKVKIVSSCPVCGKIHVFHVNELMCPFTPKKD